MKGAFLDEIIQDSRRFDLDGLRGGSRTTIPARWDDHTWREASACPTAGETETTETRRIRDLIAVSVGWSLGGGGEYDGGSGVVEVDHRHPVAPLRQKVSHPCDKISRPYPSPDSSRVLGFFFFSPSPEYPQNSTNHKCRTKYIFRYVGL